MRLGKYVKVYGCIWAHVHMCVWLYVKYKPLIRILSWRPERQDWNPSCQHAPWWQLVQWAKWHTKDCSNWQNLIFQIFVFNCAFSYYLICYTSNHLDFMKMNTCIVQECKTNKIRSYDSLPEFATWIINNYYLHCAD